MGNTSPWNSIGSFTRNSDTEIDINLGSIADTNDILRKSRPIRFEPTYSAATGISFSPTTPGDQFSINGVAVTAGTTLADMIAAISGAAITGIVPSNSGGNLKITNITGYPIVIAAISGTVLADLGLSAGTYTKAAAAYALLFTATTKISIAYNFLRSTDTAQQAYYIGAVQFAPDFATLGITPPTNTGYTFSINTYNSPGGPDEQSQASAEKTGSYTMIWVSYTTGDTFRKYISNAINEPLPGQLTFTAGDPDTPVGYSIWTPATGVEVDLKELDVSRICTVIGSPFTAAYDSLQWGPLSHVVSERFFLGGQYAAVASVDVMYDVYQQFRRWALPIAHLTYGEWEVVTEDTSATFDKINFAINGTNVLTTNAGVGKEVQTSASILVKSILTSDLDPSVLTINPLDLLTIVTDAGGGNLDASDLSILLTFILE